MGPAGVVLRSRRKQGGCPTLFWKVSIHSVQLKARAPPRARLAWSDCLRASHDRQGRLVGWFLLASRGGSQDAPRFTLGGQPADEYELEPH